MRDNSRAEVAVPMEGRLDQLGGAQGYETLVAAYAISTRIADEPAFCWWVHITVKHRDQIRAKAASKYWQRTHKHGIKIPETVKDTLVGCNL